MNFVKSLLRVVIKGVLGVLAILAGLLLTIFLGSQRLPAPGGVSITEVIFTGVHVVDVINGTVSRDQSLHIRSGKIVAIQPSMEVAAEDRGLVVDRTGSYVIPGLWDMHAHLLKYDVPVAGPAQVMNGVMYVREMGSDCVEGSCGLGQPIERSRRVQAAVAANEVLAPHFMGLSSYHVAGRQKGADRGYPSEPSFMVPGSRDEGAALHGYFASRGVDFVKTYNSLEPAAYRGLLDAAKRGGPYVGGHVPRAVTMTDALAWGHRSVEHARMLPLACSDQAEAFATAYSDWAESSQVPEETQPERPELDEWYPAILAGADAQRCDEVLLQWARSGSAYVPTHITRQADLLLHTRAFENDQRLRYIPWIRAANWQRSARRYEEKFVTSPGRFADYEAFFQRGLALTLRAYEAGVPLLIGTDSADTLVYPGFSYLDEAMLYAAAGIPSAAILKMATVDAAIFSGEEAQHGTIEPGKAANLVFLNRDPTIDIAALGDIGGLFYQSAFYDKQAIGDELDDAAWRATPIGFMLSSGWWFLTEAVPALAATGGDGDPHPPH